MRDLFRVQKSRNSISYQKYAGRKSQSEREREEGRAQSIQLFPHWKGKFVREGLNQIHSFEKEGEPGSGSRERPAKLGSKPEKKGGRRGKRRADGGRS